MIDKEFMDTITLQFAAILSACMLDTRESRLPRATSDSPAWTGTYDHVCRKVDQLIEARERIEMLEWLLGDAVRYFRSAKAEFRPTTTNSHVDDFLARVKRLEEEGKL